MRIRALIPVLSLAALFVATSGTASAFDARIQAKLRLTSSSPNSPAGATLNLNRPDLPNGKPKTEAVGVFKLPKGTKISHTAVPPCKLSDLMLQVQGTAGCPASYLGAGSATLVTGLGSPIDPYTIHEHWYYAPGELVVLYTNNSGDSPVLKVGRVKIKGATFIAPLDLPPGYPPGSKTSPKETDVALDRYVGPRGAFITTPRSCPRSRNWITTVFLTYDDHTTDRVTDATRCTRRVRHQHWQRHYPKPAPRTRRPNSFDGSCRLTGELEFSTPLGNGLSTTKLADHAKGTCTGKLNGVTVTNIPVVNQVTGTATANCATGTAHTVDTLIFARRYRIVIFTDSYFAGTQGIAHTVGAVSGHSVEHVNLLPYVDQSTLAACNAGTLRKARYDLEAKTITPLVG